MAKTQYMIIGCDEDACKKYDLFLHGKNLEKVTKFKYLGSIITSDGKIDEELKARIAKAGSCFGAMIKFMCNRGYISIETKLKVLNCVIIPTIIYACESWNMSLDQEIRLNTLEYRWLRSMVGTHLLEYIPNIDLRLALCGGLVEVSRVIEKQRLRFLGHIIRTNEYDKDSLLYKMYSWAPPPGWKLPRGRPPIRWMDCICRSLHKIGLVKEIRKRKRDKSTQSKRGRPRKSSCGENELYLESHLVPDWDVIEIIAFDRSEWYSTINSIDNYEFLTKIRIFFAGVGD